MNAIKLLMLAFTVALVACAAEASPSNVGDAPTEAVELATSHVTPDPCSCLTHLAVCEATVFAPPFDRSLCGMSPSCPRPSESVAKCNLDTSVGLCCMFAGEAAPGR